MFLGEARLPAGLRIYAIGDIHGRSDCLNALLTMIESDVERDAPQAFKIITLGDYCDRGPDSFGVLELLAQRANGTDFICLRGNHDQWLEAFLHDPEEVGESFLYWGGLDTVASYGVPVELTGQGHGDLSRMLNRAMPVAHRRFLAGLRFCHSEGDYFFCHAGVRPQVPLDEQDPHDLMWIRNEFLLHTDSFGKVVIHGHTPWLDVDVHPNRINLDSRAFETGILSCVVLEGESHRFLQTGKQGG